MLAVFATFCLCYFIVTVANIWTALHATPRAVVQLVDIGSGVIAFATLVWAGKEIQKAIENKGPQPPVDPSASQPGG
jgi:hypothetical protein